MGGFISRRFTEQDKRELNDLYNYVFNHARTIENFDWEFIDNPQGKAHSWVLKDSDPPRIIGHYGLIPLEFGYFGKSLLAGKTENAMLHPEYRGKGLYQPFEVDCIQQASQRFQLIWTSYSAAVNTHIKAGYIPVGKLISYVHVNKASMATMLEDLIKNKTGISNRKLNVFLRKLSECAAQILTLMFSRSPVADGEMELKRVEDINTIAKELDELWDSVKAEYGITVARSARYLRWRISNNPYLKYDFHIVLKHQKVVGYVITCIVSRRGKNKKGIIVDILATEPSTKILDCILAQAVSIFHRSGVERIEFPTLKSDNFINKALKRAGFVSFDSIYTKLRGSNPDFLVIPLDNTLNSKVVFDPNNWYFTNIFTEGVRFD